MFLITRWVLLLAFLVAMASFLWRSGPFRSHVLWLSSTAACAAGIIVVRAGVWQAIPALAVTGGLLCWLIVDYVRSPNATTRLRSIRRNRGATIAVAVTLALSCELPFYFFPIFALPQPDGPYPIGTRQFDVTNNGTASGSSQGAPSRSRILIQVWYPAAPVANHRPSAYLNEREVKMQAPAIARNFDLPPFVLGHLGVVQTHSVQGAPIVATTGTLPVIVFSHGYWSYPAQNTALMEDLASHGYVVFSLGHPQDAATLVFSDGTTIPTTPYVSSDAVASPGERAFWGSPTHNERCGPNSTGASTKKSFSTSSPTTCS